MMGLYIPDSMRVSRYDWGQIEAAPGGASTPFARGLPINTTESR